jgi:hypothetical protein
MKWYYEWRLSRIRAEISALRESTQVKLLEDYTGHSRLRVLDRVAGSLQQRLARYEKASHARTQETVQKVASISEPTQPQQPAA